MTPDQVHIAQTRQYFRELLNHLFIYGGDFESAANEAQSAALSAGMSLRDTQDYFGLIWCDLIRASLCDHILTEEEESRIVQIKRAFSVSDTLAVVEDANLRLVQAALLRDLKNGIVRPRFQLSSTLPFKLQSKESVLWSFSGVELFEQITKRETRGGSRGVSVRVMKGVYFRLGAFKAEPIAWDETKNTGTGLLVLTNKHLFFSGGLRNLKIPYTKLSLVSPGETVLTIQKDGANAKPQVFKCLDGWLAYNIIQLS